MLAIGSPLSWSEGGQFPFKTGKVFIHGRDTGGVQTWGPIRNIQPTLFVPNARYGRSVSMHGSRIAVGAPGYFITSTNGSVFVYEHHSSGAIELPAPTRAGNLSAAGFGERVALSGNQLAVGTPTGGAVVTVYERRVDYPSDNLTIISWHPGILHAPGIHPGAPLRPGVGFGSVLSLNQGTLVVSGQTLAYADEDVENDVPIYVRVDSLVRFEHQGDAGGNSALNWKLEANTPAEAFNLRGIANSAISGSLLVATSTNDN